jgi:hypothetical protein
VLQRLLHGSSLAQCVRTETADRRTIARWWQWLQQCGERFAFPLRARLPELGRVDGFVAFWRELFKTMDLAGAMALLDRQMIVP